MKKLVTIIGLLSISLAASAAELPDLLKRTNCSITIYNTDVQSGLNGNGVGIKYQLLAAKLSRQMRLGYQSQDKKLEAYVEASADGASVVLNVIKTNWLGHSNWVTSQYVVASPDNLLRPSSNSLSADNYSLYCETH